MTPIFVILVLSFAYSVWGFLPLPPMSELYQIMSSRAIFSSFQRRLSYEVLDSDNIIQLFERYQTLHSLDTFLAMSVGASLISLFYWNSASLPIRKWSEYSTFERRVNTFILVFMLIMTKNVEHVL